MKVFIQSMLYLSVGLGSLFFVIWVFTSPPFFQSFAQAEEPVKKAPVTPSSPQESAPVERKGTAPPVVKMNADAAEKKVPANGKKEEPTKEALATPSTGPASKVEPVNNKEGSPSVSDKNAAQPSSPDVIDSKETTPQVEKKVPVQRSGASVPDNSSVVSPPPELAPDKEGAVPPPPPPVPDAVNNDTGQQPNKEKKEGDAVSEQESVGAAHSADLDNLLESAKDLQKGKGSSADAASKLMDINEQVGRIYNKVSNMYKYDPEEKRDPFVPPKMEKVDDVELAVPTYPTGKYDLSEIKLKGIKWNSGAGPSKALFETPDNVIHYLQKNDWIGKNRGVIYQLKEDEVIVVERRLTGNINKQEDSYVPVVVRLDRLTNKKKK
jgi:hypothetical protein